MGKRPLLNRRSWGSLWPAWSRFGKTARTVPSFRKARMRTASTSRPAMLIARWFPLGGLTVRVDQDSLSVKLEIHSLCRDDCHAALSCLLHHVGVELDPAQGDRR